MEESGVNMRNYMNLVKNSRIQWQTDTQVRDEIIGISNNELVYTDIDYDFINITHPIGSTYTQYTDDDPNALFPETEWILDSDKEGESLFTHIHTDYLPHHTARVYSENPYHTHKVKIEVTLSKNHKHSISSHTHELSKHSHGYTLPNDVETTRLIINSSVGSSKILTFSNYEVGKGMSYYVSGENNAKSTTPTYSDNYNAFFQNPVTINKVLIEDHEEIGGEEYRVRNKIMKIWRRVK